MPKLSVGFGTLRPAFATIRRGERTLTLREPLASTGDSIETRRAVKHAVQTMRCATAAENEPLQLELSFQAARQLSSAFAREASERGSSTGPSSETLDRIRGLRGSQAHAQVLAALSESAPPSRVATLNSKACERFFIWLEAQLETRSKREIAAQRWLRSIAFGAATLGCLVWLVLPKNIARGMHVSASSICGSTPEPPLGHERLFRVVDGRDTEQGFAVCTELEQKPWVEVDLARARRVQRVLVYPRSDCCYGHDELPLSVEISTDARHFETVGTSTSPATRDSPWRFEIPRQQARYVRVTSLANAKRHVVIGEIEVYGS